MADSNVALLSRALRRVGTPETGAIVEWFGEGAGLEDSRVDILRLPFEDAYELRLTVTCFSVETLSPREIMASIEASDGLTQLVKAKGRRARRQLLEYMRDFAVKHLAEIEDVG